MRTITYYLATNQVVESDAIYPNAFSADDNTTQLIFDYTGTACATWDKWLDLTMSDYTKDVQSLGTGTIVTFNLGAEHTKKGLLQVNPYAKNGTDKHGFPIYKLTIERQLNNSTVDASVQQSMIDYFDDRLTVKAVSATTLAPGESATASVTTEADGTTYVFGIPQGAQGIQGIQGVKGAQWRGAYSAGTAYVIDDVVSYNGSSYICILASTGNLPTNATYWSLVAEKGADGAGGGSTLVASYTHTLNTEIIVSSVDVDTDTFTSVGHGLVNGNMVMPMVNKTSGKIYPLAVYAGGLGFIATGYYVVSATADTFKLSLTNGGVAINLTTNATMDLSKWHFEKTSLYPTYTLSGLTPSKKYRVRILGRTLTADTCLFFANTSPGATSTFRTGATTLGFPTILPYGDIAFSIDAYIDSTVAPMYTGTYNCIRSATPSTYTTLSSPFVEMSPTQWDIDITSVTIGAALANGSKIEVYAV